MSGYRVAGDWGTSRLRLFRIADGTVGDRREGPGIGGLTRAPDMVLREALADWRGDGDPDGIVLCGMVGSRNGWVEVPYVACPADVGTWLAGARTLPLDGIPVTIMAGLASAPSAPPDVMRGEETQLFGAIARDPALARGRHLLAMPGTHSKWATIEDGRIVAFRTFMTGEMFALLRDRSTLTSVDPGGAIDEAAEQEGFAHGLARGGSGELLLGGLFEARSAQLLGGRSAGWAIGFLSGLLIAREIGEATAGLEGHADIGIIADPRLAERYRRALAERGMGAHLLDGDACARAGLALLETP